MKLGRSSEFGVNAVPDFRYIHCALVEAQCLGNGAVHRHPVGGQVPVAQQLLGVFKDKLPAQVQVFQVVGELAVLGNIGNDDRDFILAGMDRTRGEFIPVIIWCAEWVRVFQRAGNFGLMGLVDKCFEMRCIRRWKKLRQVLTANIFDRKKQLFRLVGPAIQDLAGMGHFKHDVVHRREYPRQVLLVRF